MFIGASALGAVAALLLLLLIPKARSFTVTRVATDRLPMWLAGLLADRTILAAFSVPERKRMVVWVLDEAAHNSREQEYSTRSRTPIGAAQRVKELPPRRHLRFGRYTISLTYRLDEMDCLIEETVVTRGGSEMVRRNHPFYLALSFAPRGEDAERFASLLKAAEAEWDYDHSPDEQKVVWWVRKLYRWRRWQGESRLDPDLAFDGLRSAIERRDPAAVALIPRIIETLAKMEGEDPAGLWTRYRARAELGSGPN